MSVGTNVTLADSPATCGWSVDRSGPRIWSMLTTLIPLPMACLTRLSRPVPKMGCTMMPSYWPELMTSCSWEYWVCGLLFASKTFRVAWLSLATACAAASIGAS